MAQGLNLPSFEPLTLASLSTTTTTTTTTATSTPTTTTTTTTIQVCPGLSATRGRCGPKYGGRCNRELASDAIFCNSKNGWCGNTDAHRNAQPSEDKWDAAPSTCQVLTTVVQVCPGLSKTRGRCGPNYGGRCNRELASDAIFCNSKNGWCGNTAAHR